MSKGPMPPTMFFPPPAPLMHTEFFAAFESSSHRKFESSVDNVRPEQVSIPMRFSTSSRLVTIAEISITHSRGISHQSGSSRCCIGFE